ncbi:hypothetical protein ACH5RR_032919 [Cinchona calisaya]|uniref:Acid phosphatase n=1 Tax=Cinchona calisaya TaxID=153742 RepID=A0ABD2YJH2_9GENT
MAKSLGFLLAIFCFLLGSAAADWNILKQKGKNGLQITLKREKWTSNHSEELLGNKLNLTSLEEWMNQGKAPALQHSLKLFNELKDLGVQIILVSSRMEHLRSATVDNIVNEGFFGWTSLILRGSDDACKDIQRYKYDVRKQLISDGYRIWGILGDQWSSIEGLPSAKRTFKLPNPLYYTA